MPKNKRDAHININCASYIFIDGMVNICKANRDRTTTKHKENWSLYIPTNIWYKRTKSQNLNVSRHAVGFAESLEARC